MKLKIQTFLSSLLMLFIASCNSNSKFDYDNKKYEYQEAVNCLLQNYSMIFTSSRLENSASLYQKDFNDNSLCKNVFKLMQIHSIDFVNFYKDSTIAFYAKSEQGIKEKQFILMFANDRKKVIEKLSSDIKIINEKDKGCYELERIISLAN